MLHTICNDLLQVTVTEKGAELKSIRSADGTEYLWQGDPAYWSGQAPNIFPYVGRMVQGTYELDGQQYQMKIHGIARYRRFAVIAEEADALILELVSDAETRASYPRDFVFRVEYRLDGSTLRITFRVENRDERTMYFGLGGHPGFRVPLTEGLQFEDYRLRFSQPSTPRRVLFSADCFVSGETAPYPLEDGCILPLRHDLFDDDAIVLQNTDRRLTLESEKDGRSVTVTFPGMEYIGLWHMPKTDAPYLCIEPWCSLPASQGHINAMEDQADLLQLAPGQTYENNWEITIR